MKENKQKYLFDGRLTYENEKDMDRLCSSLNKELAFDIINIALEKAILNNSYTIMEIEVLSRVIRYLKE